MQDGSAPAMGERCRGLQRERSANPRRAPTRTLIRGGVPPPHSRVLPDMRAASAMDDALFWRCWHMATEDKVP